MTGHPNHVADDQDEFWDFDPTEERMTMTVDPYTHYAEQAVLAAAIAWSVARERFGVTSTGSAETLITASGRLAKASLALKALYDAQEQM